MPDKNPHSREERFKQRDSRLHTFYDAESNLLSKQEAESLTPILNSIQNQTDRYITLGKVAEGAEKRITIVHDYRLDRCVAMAHPVKNRTREDKEQFLREARLLANLTHPNIMPVHNMGFDPQGTPFFTMELVKGDSLKEIITRLHEGNTDYRSHFPLEQLLNIYLKICDAVAYAHSREVLHLDLKPDNIRVGEYGEVFVCDWGLAKVLHSSKTTNATHDTENDLDGDILNDITQTGIVKGSPGFMAPEQTVAERAKTKQTDIYSLGAMLYALLTYHPPVRGDSATEMMENTRKGNIIPIKKRHSEPKIPAGLMAVALKALAFNPGERYKSVMDLREEIHRYLGGYSTRAERAGPITHLSLLMQRHIRMAFLLFLFLLMFGGLSTLHHLSIQENQNNLQTERKQTALYENLFIHQKSRATNSTHNYRQALLDIIRNPSYATPEPTLRVLHQQSRAGISPGQHQNLMAYQGSLHFILHQFKAANHCFEYAQDRTRPIKTICEISEQFAPIKTNDNQLLTYPQMAELIRLSTKRNNPSSNIIIYYAYLHFLQNRISNSIQDQLYLTEAILDKLNGHKRPSPALRLTSTPKGNHLDLSGSAYRNLTLKLDQAYYQNVLEPLNLTSLDISGMSLGSLLELKGLDLKKLNIVDADFSHNFVVSRLKRLGLESLTLNTNAFDHETLRLLKEQMTLIHQESIPQPQ